MELKITSFNSTGFNGEKSFFTNFVSDILKTDILFIQEHMHLKANLYKIQKEFPQFNSFLLPATKKNENVNFGRPSGGLGIFWLKNLSNNVRVIKHPDSNRVQGIQLFQKYVLINVYFPNDPNVLNFDDFDLLKCLEDITWFFNEFPDNKFIIGGDFNCDFSRQSRFVALVREFLRNNNLFTVWSQFGIDFTYCQHSVRNGNNVFSTSCIDHFCLQSNISHDVSHAQVIHLGDNLSNHEPIFISLKIDSKPDGVFEQNVGNANNNEKPLWFKASAENIEDYRNELKCYLDEFILNDGLKCNDVNCDNPNHLIDIDNVYNYLSDSIDFAVKNNIPRSGNNIGNNPQNNRAIPGWNDYVKPFREDAKFWHSIWLSLGKPLNCEVFHIMKRTRNRFHFAVRKVKKYKVKIEQDKLLQTFLEGKVSNVAKFLKKQRASCSEKMPNLIDGRVGKDNIANYLAQKYSTLYNSSNSNVETMKLVDDLNISQNDLCDVELVTPDIVYQAISCVNVNTNDVNFNFKSNALRVGADIICNYLTAMLQAFLIHGYIPKELVFCSLKPIIKDKLGDKFNSDNYRAIGSSSLILKVLDWVIFILFESNLKPSELQFGFQKKNSTTMCSWTVIETINYFNNRETPVYSCFLDLSKAFDLVDFAKLFCKLKDRISYIFIRLLAYIYVFQSCCVDWGGTKSNPFKVSCGIRQGAVLSPILFSIYINDLFHIMETSGFGCFIQNIYYGIVGYADDLVLLSPDLKGLQKMFDIAKKFLENLGLKISVNINSPEKSKTKCLAFGTKNDPLTFIKLNDFNIPWCDKYKHLGHMFYRDGSLNLDVDLKKRIFIGTFFELKQELKSPDPNVFMNLVLLYISHFYGSNLWNLFDISPIYTAWNKIVRIIFDLPYRTHRYLLEPVTGFHHIFTLLINRFLKFYSTLFNSDKKVISNLRLCQEKDCRSTFGLNIRNITLANNTFNIFDCERFSIKYFPMNENETWRVNSLKELMLCKDLFEINGFTEDEINDLIYFIACS